MILSSQTKPFRLGFIGLGIMGRPMVDRLLACGWQVTIWNLEPEMAKAATAAGAVWAETPRAVREASDIVLTCVLDAKAVDNVCFGPDGIAFAESGADLLVDCTTMNPDRAIALAARLTKAGGMGWIDAPISGGPQPAAEGALTVMAGGSNADFERVRPILSDLAGNITLMGPIGSGQAVKVINQAIVGTCYTLMAEVLAMARESGIDAARLPACLEHGLADSVILQRIFPQMEQRDFDPPRSYARQLNKDMQNLGTFARELGLDLPLIETAIERYRQFHARGNELADSASISRLYEVPSPGALLHNSDA